ncbi:MAG: hypothetical protein V3T15_04500, partial [Pseudomonadales bacterium]
MPYNRSHSAYRGSLEPRLFVRRQKPPRHARVHLSPLLIVDPYAGNALRAGRNGYIGRVSQRDFGVRKLEPGCVGWHTPTLHQTMQGSASTQPVLPSL